MLPPSSVHSEKIHAVDAPPTKPHALFITPFIPDLAGGGSPMRAAMHLTALTGRYNVTVLALPHRRSDAKKRIPAEIGKHCYATQIVYQARQQNGPKRNPGLLMALARELKTSSESIAQRIEGEEVISIFNNKCFDIVFCFRSRMALAFLELLSYLDISFVKKVVDFDDVESECTFREARLSRRRIGFEATFIQYLRAWRLRKLEKRLLDDFDATFVCSERDRNRLSRRAPRAVVRVIPNAIRLPDMVSQAPSETPLTLIFVGSMGYPANQDAAVHFCTRVLPLVREGVGTDVTVLLVGRDPPEAVRALERIPGVVVTGTVDDVGPYYGRSHVAIVPIRYGGGTRIKIVEAFAYGRPVVSTAIGAEGLEVEDGRNILIADTPQDFAAAILRLAREPALGQGLVQAGRRLAEEKYGLEAGKRAVLAGLPGGRA